MEQDCIWPQLSLTTGQEEEEEEEEEDIIFIFNHQYGGNIIQHNRNKKITLRGLPLIRSPQSIYSADVLGAIKANARREKAHWEHRPQNNSTLKMQIAPPQTHPQ